MCATIAKRYSRYVGCDFVLGVVLHFAYEAPEAEARYEVPVRTDLIEMVGCVRLLEFLSKAGNIIDTGTLGPPQLTLVVTGGLAAGGITPALASPGVRNT